ncbi:uncharacterized protein MONOS_3422 [Monocercomonoides exilis]|uniref:uncharacterized protein n=1 Tax=Monocercomonoides exilis TaxID=2049356 RepID=UPI00355A6399|nr:hypothetical protein MONOS_3422 [Monocercomonoides exilis]|eukprot:MONOS_3422.1-p1 / transcript=MONOS_3422.1 / gene=MONOS_3422 / organism=Monocercomonoides_exilis_PA203 / gene_product=unspecified product / transcript_product=unspecified product / location=Mono_scaffold00080:103403-103888(-) / protein_length=161 / sequence_SO=supercontig / SO=protein_coding / is_pseudo=false
MAETTLEVQLVEREEERVAGIGVMCTMSDVKEKCMDLWGKQFVPRIREVSSCGGDLSYGLSIMTGSSESDPFLYVATAPLDEGKAVPEGMKEYTLAKGTYLSVQLKSMDEIGAGYQAMEKKLKESYPEYEFRMDVPSFELYEDDFMKTGHLKLFGCIRKKE